MKNSNLIRQWFKGCAVCETEHSIKFFNPYLNNTTEIWYNSFNNTYGFARKSYSGNYRAEDDTADGLLFSDIQRQFDNMSSVSPTLTDVTNVLQELRKRFG